MTAAIPGSVEEWLAALPVRRDWGGWDEVGGSLARGVQNWSDQGDDQTAVGVWGNVVEDEAGAVRVNWCVSIGRSIEPERCGFETAAAAMDWAEERFPDRFGG